MSNPNFAIPAEYITLHRFLSKWFNISTEEGQRTQYPKPMHHNNIWDPCVLAHQHTMDVFKDSYPHPFLVVERQKQQLLHTWQMGRCAMLYCQTQHVCFVGCYSPQAGLATEDEESHCKPRVYS